MHDHTAIAPVVKSVEVALAPPEAFDLFTRRMGEWWPLGRHSIAADSFDGEFAAQTVVFEPHAGGRIYEVMSDGREMPWGAVTVWEPPQRVVFSWRPNLSDRPHTHVEVRFTATAAGTRVVLEHRGWELLGDDAEHARSSYEGGWVGVLRLFSDAAVKG